MYFKVRLRKKAATKIIRTRGRRTKTMKTWRKSECTCPNSGWAETDVRAEIQAGLKLMFEPTYRGH
jgi:hypothetical protein